MATKSQNISTRGGVRRTSTVMYSQSADPLNVVSRQSGLKADVGTFGKKARFGADRLLQDEGVHSPWGPSFFKNNRFWKDDHEQGKKAGFGVGSRPPYVRGLPNVGPGTYTPITSVAKPASSLDGKKYCKVTMKIRPKVVVGGVSPHEEAIKPGPGTYTLPDEICGEYVLRGANKRDWVGPNAPKLGMPLREVDDPTGDALYDVSVGLGDKRIPFNDPKRSSTFGFHRRWEDGKSCSSQSPNGALYYSHVKLNEDYTKLGKASSLGVGERPDLHPSQHLASPASYFPVTSVAKITSPLDGFAMRNLSPVTQFAMVKQRRGTSVPG